MRPRGQRARARPCSTRGRSGNLQGMRITTWAEYGLISALHLARRADEGPVTGRDLATREKLPADYVEQIMLRLRRAEIVRSTRGAHGGYVLARAAHEISVREIIQASELSTFDLHCVSHPVNSERCAASRRLQHSPGVGAAATEDRRRARGRAPLRSPARRAGRARARRTSDSHRLIATRPVIIGRFARGRSIAISGAARRAYVAALYARAGGRRRARG